MGILTNILFHKVNNVGLHEAQNELTKLISRRELFPGKSVVKKLSNLEEEGEDDLELTNKSGANSTDKLE